MGFMDKVKGAWGAVKAAFTPDAQQQADLSQGRGRSIGDRVLVVHPSTPKGVREALADVPGVEVVESKPLPDSTDGWISRLFGAELPIQFRPKDWRLPGKLRGNGYVHNETFDVGINRAKRSIKAIKNRRERNAARSRFIQNLRASGIKS